ncbi:MAG: hypothetical protein Q7U16_12530 [Agitococcus sp.]|nr:hypothetical protein [Agitococcus sp.]
MHQKALTQNEDEGLRLHGLKTGTPSQLSDAFRLGMAWQLSLEKNPVKSMRFSHLSDCAINREPSFNNSLLDLIVECDCGAVGKQAQPT